jgi:alkylation response protein AidB-like acyl-CoA dehydrogenase
MVMFTQEQKILQNEVRKLARNKFGPKAAEVDAKGEFPWENFELIKENGFLRAFFPEEYGGIGTNMTSACIISEETAKACVNTACILAAIALSGINILLAGTEEQKRRILTQVSDGRCLCSTGMTEPNAGSDIGSLETRAVLDGDHYVINGTKIFCTNAEVADIILVFARTAPKGNPAEKHKGISIFAVEKGTPGLIMGRKEDKLCTRATSAWQFYLQDCRVHKDSLLGGKEGLGFITGMKTLDYARCVSAATAVGLAQGALDYSVHYAKERIQFGQPISSFQGIQFMMAEMAMEIEAARQLTYRASHLLDEKNNRVAVAGAMAKAYAADMVMKVTVDALQILGGHGLTKEHPVERMLRDAKVFAIGEGTTEIQKIVIARDLIAGS